MDINSYKQLDVRGSVLMQAYRAIKDENESLKKAYKMLDTDIYFGLDEGHLSTLYVELQELVEQGDPYNPGLVLKKVQAVANEYACLEQKVGALNTLFEHHRRWIDYKFFMGRDLWEKVQDMRFVLYRNPSYHQFNSYSIEIDKTYKQLEQVTSRYKNSFIYTRLRKIEDWVLSIVS